jgi:hypothetical protein
MKLVKLMTLLFIFYSFSACKKESTDPAVAAVIEDFTEITINGNTVKENTLISSGSQNEFNYEFRGFYQAQTAAYFINLSLNYIKYDKDFIAANLNPGEYRLHNYPYSYSEDKIKNLDLNIQMTNNSASSYTSFKIQEGAKHTVTSIVNKGLSKDGYNLYAINATFSCKFLDEKNNTPYTISGKYQYTISLLK